MKNKNYTSEWLSKKLRDNGCDLESEYCTRINKSPAINYEIKRPPITQNEVRRYDILNDLCVKYAKEIWGDGNEKLDCVNCAIDKEPCNCEEVDKGYFHSQQILSLLQEDKKDKAEKYLWDHCLFNPKNK